MEFRLFQILVPLFTLFMCFSLWMKLKKSRITVYEGVVGSLFWLSIGIFAIFPDNISVLVANFFGFESNVNAIIFSCIGVIFFIQYKLYFQIKKQEAALTQLTRSLALREEQEQTKE